MKTTFTAGLLSIFGILWLTSAAAVTQVPQQWRFQVFLDDQQIGYHTVTVNPEKTRATVQIEANFDVKFLFFTAYRYRHNNREIWENDCLNTIESRTNDNGDTFYVSGQSQNQRLDLDTPQGTQSLQGCVRTFAYWDPRLLQARRLLNSQTGEYLDVNINFISNEALIINGNSVLAKRYRLEAEDIVIDLWYSESMQWLALQTTTDGGNQLRYQLENFPI